MTSHLQRIQNNAARVILRLPKSSNITAHLKSRHWHPLNVISTYGIACLCYHCHCSSAPSYVADMLKKKPSLVAAYTPCLFSIDLHTVRQHLVMARFLLPLLSGTLFQMMSGGGGGGGGVDPIPCVSTHRISDPRSGPAQLLPHMSSSAATPTGSVHKSQTVSVVGMSGQLKRCNESWFGSLQSGQFAAGWLAGSILCR